MRNLYTVIPGRNPSPTPEPSPQSDINVETLYRCTIRYKFRHPWESGVDHYQRTLDLAYLHAKPHRITVESPTEYQDKATLVLLGHDREKVKELAERICAFIRKSNGHQVQT